MQLESLDPAGTDPAMHPPAAAMQQSPESLGDAGNDSAAMQQDPEFPENVGEDAGKHLLPWSSSASFISFARPVFGRWRPATAPPRSPSVTRSIRAFASRKSARTRGGLTPR